MPRVPLIPPLAPCNGPFLRVISIDRISTKNQDPKSNDDQEALMHRWIADRYEGEVKWTRITGQGSGERIDRHQVRDAEDLVESGRFDLVIMEDLGRHLRRSQAIGFCELCEDHDTRLIAINDGIDTAGSWRLHAFFAAIKHEQFNKETSERIKRTLRNRFVNGGVFQAPLFGYIKPSDAKGDADVRKDPSAEPIYEEWFSRLESDASYAEVADWLNQMRVPLGPSCRSKRWTGPMVRRITLNPILKGVRVRNRKMSKRVNATGRPKMVNAAPEDLLERQCPHLAFFEPGRYDRLINKLTRKNAMYTVGRLTGIDPRKNGPKKRTRFPGQMIDCGICGRPYVFGGHGRTDHLMCSGARKHVCWNGSTVDGPLAAPKISAAMSALIESLDGFDPRFLSRIDEEAAKVDSARADLLRELDTKLRKNEREITNLLGFIRGGDESQSVRSELKRLEGLHEQFRLEKVAAEQASTEEIVIPPIEELRQLARESFQGLAVGSFEFATAMRRLIGRIVVLPYCLCDGASIVLRARFDISLTSLLPNERTRELLRPQVLRTLHVDLFHPPQRVAFRESVLELRRGSAERKPMSEKEAASSLELTITAAQRAAALDRIMLSRGIVDPYVPLREPPLDDPKRRRHLHPRYHFDPLPGFPLEPW
jgi:site-specific DNA recombinase